MGNESRKAVGIDAPAIFFPAHINERRLFCFNCFHARTVRLSIEYDILCDRCEIGNGQRNGQRCRCDVGIRIIGDVTYTLDGHAYLVIFSRQYVAVVPVGSEGGASGCRSRLCMTVIAVLFIVLFLILSALFWNFSSASHLMIYTREADTRVGPT